MDDTTIYTAVPDAADTVIGISVVSQNGLTISGSSILASHNNVTLVGSIQGASIRRRRVTVDEYGFLKYEDEEPEPPKPEAKPRKPPPALPVEAWATREFDADAAHAATLSLCRGQ